MRVCTYAYVFIISHLNLYPTSFFGSPDTPTALKKSTYKIPIIFLNLPFLLFLTLLSESDLPYHTIHPKWIPKSHSRLLNLPPFKPINSNILYLLNIIDYPF